LIDENIIQATYGCPGYRGVELGVIDTGHEKGREGDDEESCAV
jgi:hypothetical protein